LFYITIKSGACALKEIQRQTGLACHEFKLVSVADLNWGTKDKPQFANGYMKVVYQLRAS